MEDLFAPLFLLAMLVIGAASIYKDLQAKMNPTPAAEPLVAEESPVYDEQPTEPPVQDSPEMMEVRSKHQEVLMLLNENHEHPALSPLVEEITHQSGELLERAEDIYSSQLRTRHFLIQDPPRLEEVRQLELRITKEPDDEVRATLESTLATKRREWESFGRLHKAERRMAALLEEAGAALSELRARIALAITESSEMAGPRQQLELSEASMSLHSLSETMRGTLEEVAGL